MYPDSNSNSDTTYGANFSAALSPGELISGVDVPLQQPLAGTVIGTSGSYKNDGNTIANAFDGNLSSYFDGATANGNYAGRNLGTPTVINGVAFAPRSGWANRMVGGIFQGSNSPDFSNAVTLYTISTAPVTGVLTYEMILDTDAYQYVRYLSPNGSYGDVAEVQFFHQVPVNAFYSDGILTVTGTPGNDSIVIDYDINETATGNTGDIIIIENGAFEGYEAAGVSGIAVNSGDGNDSIFISGTDENDTGTPGNPLTSISVVGGSGNDVVNVQPTAVYTYGQYLYPITRIQLGDGNDTITASAVQDLISAGNGNDTVNIEQQYDGVIASISLGNGNNLINVGYSDDELLAVSAVVGSGRNTIDADGGPFTSVSISAGGEAPVTVAGDDVFEILGRVFVDSNNDGKFDSNEALVIDATVYLDLNDDGVFDAGDISTTTNSQGDYAFTGLSPFQNNVSQFTYTVRVEPIPGYSIESQDQALTHTVSDGDQDGYAFTGNDFAMRPAILKLTGTPIGTPGSYRNHGTTIADAFDGNLSTYFDGPDASGDWVGLDLGTAQVVTQVQYAPRAGYETRMDGGEIQASNSANFSSGVVTLFTITSTPTAGVLTTQKLSNTTAYRYYRYIGPANSYCDIAELVFNG